MFPGETILSGAKVDEHVSPFRVMRSAAGYYVGTLYTYCGDEKCERCDDPGFPMYAGFQEPYSRETGYFGTEEEAKTALDLFNSTGHLERARQ